jgi:integrase
MDRGHQQSLEVGVDIPSIDEIRAILAAAEGRWRPLVVTAILTGLRASELRGLRWADVNLDDAKLTVTQRADRWNQIGSPKSDSGNRTVPLARMVVNTLREWKLACPKGLGLVFPNGSGNAENLPNIHRRVLGPLQVAAGVSTDPHAPKYGLKAFRHAAASLFIAEGFNAKEVQVVMGHANISVTLDTYTHLFPTEVDHQTKLRRIQARLVS